MAATGYVGIEPEGALRVAEAMLRTADDTTARAARIGALLADAGDSDATPRELRQLQGWLLLQSADVRRRAATAAFTPRTPVDPACVPPLYDPLVRAAKAVWNNATRPVLGAAESTADTGRSIWQLVPGVDGWRQAWVAIPAGLAAAARDPKAAGVAMADLDTLNEDGFSYWVGGFVPDVAGLFLGGAGAVKTSVKVAEKAAEVADKAKNSRALAAVAQRVARRRRRDGDGGGGGDGGDAPGPRRLEPNPDIEPVAKAAVEAADEAAGGHIAARHGPETTLDQQLVRAETGLTPEGVDSYPMDASRFLRWEDAANALQRARELKGSELVTELVPCQATFARLMRSCSARSWALRLRQAM